MALRDGFSINRLEYLIAPDSGVDLPLTGTQAIQTDYRDGGQRYCPFPASPGVFRPLLGRTMRFSISRFMNIVRLQTFSRLRYRSGREPTLRRSQCAAPGIDKRSLGTRWCRFHGGTAAAYYPIGQGNHHRHVERSCRFSVVMWSVASRTRPALYLRPSRKLRTGTASFDRYVQYWLV